MKELAIITGGSRGIGYSTAERFLEAGWDVINLSRSVCDLKGIINHVCDLLDGAQIRSVLGKIDLKPYGRVTLVHNAAVTRMDTYLTASDADMLEVFRINVLAPQIINQILLPQMKAGSSVIFIGSTLSEIGVPNSLSYTTSKHALAGLMKTTCQDLAAKEIHTCLICPGFTDTQMLKEVLGTDPANWERAKQTVLFGRLATPAEIAAFIFFCSNNPVINGSVLHANLGQR